MSILITRKPINSLQIWADRENLKVKVFFQGLLCKARLGYPKKPGHDDKKEN